MEITKKQIETVENILNDTVAIQKELLEKIENRHERKNEIIDFIKNAQEKRDKCKDQDKLKILNRNLDRANFILICELDELLAEVEHSIEE
tara:strand:+ start:201 stop:473 length:273 start_codon:yes stop_codon:yes gene_type:complete